MNMRTTIGKSIGSCIAELVIGILLLIDPVGFTSLICILLGIGMFGYGIWSLIRYFRSPAEQAIKNAEFSTGLVLIAAGLFFIFWNSALLAIIPTLTVIYSILMLIFGIVKLQWVIDQVRLHVGRWYIPAIDAGLTLILAIVMLADPFATDAVLFTFIGISMIVSAVIDIAAAITVRQYLKG